MSNIDKNLIGKKRFTDKDYEELLEEKLKSLEINENESNCCAKMLKRITSGTKVSFTRNNSSVKNAKDSISAASVKKTEPQNKTIRKDLTVLPSKGEKRSLSRQSTIFKPKIKKTRTSVPTNSARNKSKIVRNKLVKMSSPSSKEKGLNLSSQSTIARQKNKKANIPHNSALSSSRVQTKILSGIKLRSSSKVSTIRRSLSRIENSIKKHNSRCIQSNKFSLENRAASKQDSGGNPSSSRESKSRNISKVSIKIKKSAAVKAVAREKKNQQSPRIKQKGKERKVTKDRDGKKMPRKNKVKYLITIHPIGQNSQHRRSGESQEEVNLTTNMEHPFELEHYESFAESMTCTIPLPIEPIEVDSNIETVLPTSSSNSLTSTANTESRSIAEIQINPETLQTDSFAVSSWNAESQAHGSPRMISQRFSMNANRYDGTIIECERPKSLNIYSQKNNPRSMRIIGGDETSDNITEDSIEQNSPEVTENQNQQNSLQTVASKSKPRNESFENAACLPNQTSSHEYRIRTRCIKPKESKQRMPGQTIGTFFRYLYRTFYGTEEE